MYLLKYINIITINNIYNYFIKNHVNGNDGP